MIVCVYTFTLSIVYIYNRKLNLCYLCHRLYVQSYNLINKAHIHKITAGYRCEVICFQLPWFAPLRGVSPTYHKCFASTCSPKGIIIMLLRAAAACIVITHSSLIN